MQKNLISICRMGVCGDESHGRWFHQECAQMGSRLEMGKTSKAASASAS